MDRKKEWDVHQALELLFCPRGTEDEFKVEAVIKAALVGLGA